MRVVSQRTLEHLNTVVDTLVGIESDIYFEIIRKTAKQTI